MNINIFRVTLYANKEFTMFIFLFYGFIMCKLDTRDIWSTPASGVHVRLKKTGTAIKIAREASNNQISI